MSNAALLANPAAHANPDRFADQPLPSAVPTPYSAIGCRLQAHQEDLLRKGKALLPEIQRCYLDKWRSESLYRVLQVRTALVSGMGDFLVERGLLNLERVQMSLVTDPLAHEVEHLPVIPYRGSPYVTTHSMIYAKFLSCHNPRLPGVFVDSPNIRLEPAAPGGIQRGRYPLDFSQLDVELRRNRHLDLESTLERPALVEEVLAADLERALAFFEGMVRAGVERVQARCPEALEALGVLLDLPPGPFPVFDLDAARRRHPGGDLEVQLGEESASPFFFITGILRENYDLVYPYLQRDGGRRPLGEVPSRQIYNYDLCVRATRRDGRPEPAVEVLSGGLREWLPEAIVARLVDQGIIPEAPRFEDGRILNLEALGGYGPFLAVVCNRDPDGRSLGLRWPRT